MIVDWVGEANPINNHHLNTTTQKAYITGLAMAELTADQRNYYYLLDAIRAGIHKPILAALYAAHKTPTLPDGDTGLGIAPANQIPLSQVNSFAAQVYYAANTIRSITNRLIAQGWQPSDLWDTQEGRYSHKFLRELAEGYAPPGNDPDSARLEESVFENLYQAYLNDLTFDYKTNGLPADLTFVEDALLTFAERSPHIYSYLPYQQDGLIEALRIWRKVNNRDEAIATLNQTIEGGNASSLDGALLQFIQGVPSRYKGFPHQREALLRLVQLWQQLDSREEVITALEDNGATPESDLAMLDSALITFVQSIPRHYFGKGEQRNALTEAFRLWQGLESRPTALTKLGVDAQLLASTNPDRGALVKAARMLDRQLIEFVGQIPHTYSETEPQREALLMLVQLWRSLESREKAVQSLIQDLRLTQTFRRDSDNSPPPPEALPLPPLPDRWTPQNLHLHCPILPNGSFTWADATQGGTDLPMRQETIEAIVRIAQLAQHARDRLGRTLHVTRWYRSPKTTERIGGASLSRHSTGDAIIFYCDGLTGNQIYWALDAWYPGGLGRYRRYPYLCYIDARPERARWLH